MGSSELPQLQQKRNGDLRLHQFSIASLQWGHPSCHNFSKKGTVTLDSTSFQSLLCDEWSERTPWRGKFTSRASRIRTYVIWLRKESSMNTIQYCIKFHWKVVFFEKRSNISTHLLIKNRLNRFIRCNFAVLVITSWQNLRILICTVIGCASCEYYQERIKVRLFVSLIVAELPSSLVLFGEC